MTVFMMTINKRLENRLPYLNAWEKKQLYALMNAESGQDQAMYETVKADLLEHLREEVARYRDWQIAADEKLDLRRKFLNITGIWDIIPHLEIKELVGQLDLAYRRPLVDDVRNPWLPTDAIDDEMEVAATDLKYIEPFREFLGLFEKEYKLTYLDYLSGSREKRVHPFADTICFRRSLADLIASKQYVSTTADPLTKTIYVSLCNGDGRRRDFISICYELVLENSFLDFYMNWQRPFQPYHVLRNMSIIALRFLACVLEWVAKQQEHAPDLRWLDAYLPRDTFLGNIELYKLYLTNLKDVFLRSNLLKLRDLNRRLGFAEDDLRINL